MNFNQQRALMIVLQHLGMAFDSDYDSSVIERGPIIIVTVLDMRDNDPGDAVRVITAMVNLENEHVTILGKKEL